MTSDLRGFELDGEIGGSGQATGVAAVLDVLGQAFGVAADRAAPGRGASQHTWLDTFDWRLNRAGLVLDYERKSRGGRLLLSKDDVPQAEQPADGPRPSPPGPPGRCGTGSPSWPAREPCCRWPPRPAPSVSPGCSMPTARPSPG